jgi:TetR/AcrR family transcriptional regulator
MHYITNQSVINFHVSEVLPHKRERRKQERPGELLEAALDLFVEKGFAATRSEEVAARAGVSKGTLFLYFPSKEELFKAVVMENVARPVAEGITEAEHFQGTSAELLEWMMLEWWRRYGATKASGISKLMMSEAGNFPALAEFFRANVILPAQALVRYVLQRGIDRGEFRHTDLPNTIYSVMAPLIFLVMEKHATGACSSALQAMDAETFIRHHASLLVRGLTPDKPL